MSLRETPTKYLGKRLNPEARAIFLLESSDKLGFIIFCCDQLTQAYAYLENSIKKQKDIDILRACDDFISSAILLKHHLVSTLPSHAKSVPSKSNHLRYRLAVIKAPHWLSQDPSSRFFPPPENQREHGCDPRLKDDEP